MSAQVTFGAAVLGAAVCAGWAFLFGYALADYRAWNARFAHRAAEKQAREAAQAAVQNRLPEQIAFDEGRVPEHRVCDWS